MTECPVFNEHIPLIVELRRRLVSQGEVEDRVQTVLMNLGRYGNSFGKSARSRASWTTGLAAPLKDARKEPVEFLWLVGDYASFDPRAQAVTRAAAAVFQRLGLDVGILYDGEQNAGNDVRRIGEEGLFGQLVEKNLQAMGKARFRAIVTTDPHTYHVVKHEYAANGSGPLHGVEVLHVVELLDRLVREGRVRFETPAGGTVTYHDPCYLGRYNGVYEAPRHLLRALGVRVVEMARNRDKAYCCGAGGGRIWMEDVPGIKERPAENRVREAAALSGVDTLVVSCPKDLVMFQDALKTTQLERALAVKDIVQLVESAGATVVRSDAHANA
jgi:Fe-S oxidoreductase